jgi:hypothetical protein
MAKVIAVETIEDVSTDGPFATIEDAHQYVALLAQEIESARASIQSDIEFARADEPGRRRDLLRLIDYKLDQLRSHIATSSRLLNDLRTLRRLLLDERSSPAPSAP